MRVPLPRRRGSLVGTLLMASLHGALAAQIPAPPPAYAVSSWTTRDGMPQSSVNSLVLDGEGYLWVATNVGVSRFDGDTFVTYPRNAARPVIEPARALTRDPDGGLWFLVANGGPARVLPGGGIERPRTDPLPEFLFLHVGHADSIWLGRISGVRRLEGRAWRPLPGLPDSIVGNLRATRRADDGTLWVGGTLGLVRHEPGSGTTRRIALSCGAVTDLALAPGGGVWVTTCAGLEWLGTGSSRTLRVLADTSAALFVLPDSTDALWLAGPDGIRRFHLDPTDRGGWHLTLQYRDPLDLAGAQPTVLVHDGASGVFVGSNGAGLRHVRRLAARRLTAADGLPGRIVHHLAPDGDTGLWIGTCHGLAAWRGGRPVRRDDAAMGLPSPCVHGLLPDREGALWVGQLSALARVGRSGRAHILYRAPSGTLDETSPLLLDREGRVWFASVLGTLGYFPPGDTAPVLVPRCVPGAGRAWSMVQEPSGALWIGQTGAVSRMEGGACTLRLTAADGVPDAAIRGLLVDAEGTLWMASYGGGLASWDAAHGVRRLPPSGRAFESMLSAIRLDRADRLWLLGDGGVTGIPRLALRRAIDRHEPVRETIEIGALEGVPEGNGGYANSWLDTTSQRLWLATVDGVAMVDVGKPEGGRRRVPVHVDDVRIDDAPALPADTLRVPSTANAVAFHFSAPRFGLDRAARVRYRLRGHDRVWIEAGPSRVARYASLSAGSYVFEVGLDGEEGAAPAAQAIPVVVAAHWWETPAARLLQAALAAGALVLIVRWRTAGIRERNRALQRESAERERAQRQAADAARELAHVSRIATAGELATSIAHELNQPLAAVMGSAQQARHHAERGDQAGLRLMLDAIEDQSERAAQVIRSLRAFVLKQPSWSDDVSPARVVTETLRLLRQELTGRGVSVRVADQRRADAPVAADAVQLQQVLANLLLNGADAVAEAPPDRRRLTVLLRDDEHGCIRISVADEGPGIPTDRLDRIFEPFFSTKPDGLGLGLSLSRSIVEAHRGRLWAEAPAEGGSVFHIVLPLAGA